jgi:hypothetical protein
MAAITFDQVLTYAESLPPEEQEILADLLKKRRIEAWREETAASGRAAVQAYRAGKLKAQSDRAVISRLRASLKTPRGN